MIDPAIGAWLAGAFALLFLSAALQKLRGLRQFTETLRAYRVLPDPLVGLSWGVPALEFTIGAGLLASASRAGACLAGAALLALYAAAIAINLHRGRYDLSCGCGGPDERRPIAAWMVWRNLMLAALLAGLLAPWSARQLDAADALTIGAGTVITALLYMSLDRLLGRLVPRSARLRGV